MTPALETAWQALRAHAGQIRPLHLRALFAGDTGRFEAFSLAHGDLLLDFSKQRLTAGTLAHLHALAEAADVSGWRRKMWAGDIINHTEGRAVRHVALRAPDAEAPPEVVRTRQRLRDFCDAIHTGKRRGHTDAPFTDVVNLGIGGSDLGPRMAAHALRAFRRPGLSAHFVSNIDGADLLPLLQRLNPATTLFIVASKTFGTQETLANASSALAWLRARVPAEKAGEIAARHFVAVSSNLEAAAAFGIPPEQVFGFQDWVGGRFSLWSPVGLVLALAIGFPQFEALLAGAHAMDLHFLCAPPRENLPLTLALLDVWNVNGLHAQNHAFFPYSQSLELFPVYLQQLEMESAGKSVDRQGARCAYATAPIVWGSAGTNGQHSFFQLLHQGNQLVPCDFLLLGRPDFPLPGHHAQIIANALAQSAALAFGQTGEEARAAGIPEHLVPYRTFPGNQPSTTLVLDRLTPHSLGQLLALYEHKVFCLGVLWNLNAFDQWGVELGKQMAKSILPHLTGGAPDTAALDASTRGLLRALGKSSQPG
ncbi:MAG: glucose-6-phosphate isomerase [Zoogloeaceae bacterium]|jgi:glucose-6-phosphate isomerase|nr:glucose-6-phosphate isomerase [Zoogloeaceae bacterium]